MSTRRAFLGTLGKALGAGGVLLPWAGNIRARSPFQPTSARPRLCR
jgi:hypothetical protein